MNAGIIKLYVPRDKWIHSLLDKEILYIQKDATGKENWMPVARSSFVNRAPIEIITHRQITFRCSTNSTMLWNIVCTKRLLANTGKV